MEDPLLNYYNNQKFLNIKNFKLHFRSKFLKKIENNNILAKCETFSLNTFVKIFLILTTKHETRFLLFQTTFVSVFDGKIIRKFT